MPHVALTDLLADVTDLGALPEPQRYALEVALLRAPLGPSPPPDGAVGLVVASLVRHLVTRGPLVVEVDDLHWLDEPSSGALAFVCRRLPERGAGVIVTRRPVAADLPGATVLAHRADEAEAAFAEALSWQTISAPRSSERGRCSATATVAPLTVVAMPSTRSVPPSRPSRQAAAGRRSHA